MSALPALPEPTTLEVASIGDLAGQLLAWADSTDDVAAVRDAANRWAAITAYVRRTSSAGIAEAEAALRRLEIRIGTLLGPPEPGKRTDLSGANDGLERQHRHELRTLAENADVVEKVIANSDDLNPPSRRRCLIEIRRRQDAETFAEINRVNQEAAPRIAAAIAATTMPTFPELIVSARFRGKHSDDAAADMRRIGATDITITEDIT